MIVTVTLNPVIDQMIRGHALAHDSNRLHPQITVERAGQRASSC